MKESESRSGEIEEPPSRVVYFLGAGATRADYPEIPLGDDLLDAVLRNEDVGKEVSAILSMVFTGSSVEPMAPKASRPRLDDVFTLMDATLSGRAACPVGWAPEKIPRFRRYLVGAMAKVITDSIGGKPAPQAKALIARAREEEAAFISTNYDVAMDTTLHDLNNVNYGLAIRNHLRFFGPIPDVPGHQDKVRHLMPLSSFENIGPTSLLKLHGSLNWLYCSRCDELDITPQYEGATVLLLDPRTGRCAAPHCTGRYEALLIGPSLEQRYENRILRETWTMAESTLHDAEKLIIVGYSLPEADYLIRAMLVRSFARRSDRVTVVDKQEAGGAQAKTLVSRYRRLLPACSFRFDGLEGYLSTAGP
ncbi:MAG: hypothetical protein ACREAA_16325 [Candidatus Polarisedimenticolia bacterium]